MHKISFAILICFIILIVDSIPSIHLHSNLNIHNKIHSRLRRREFVQEEVRKTMLNYMTSLKGEITDIVIEEMINYYNNQRIKLYDLEKELFNIKNSSLPIQNTNQILNNLILRLSKEQNLFALNISLIEYKLKNLTIILNNLLNELHQQQKPIQHVRRLVSTKQDFQYHQIPIDCDDVYSQQPSLVHEGIFRIKPRFASESFDVKCIFENNIGWTVIQRRINGTIDFYRGWNDYKNGFGDLRTEFWLGNEKIHLLTNQGRYILRIDLQPWNSPIHIAEYGKFGLDNENQNYKIHISQFRSNISTAGDSLSSLWDNTNGISFSTYDRDNDNLFYDNCALTYHGAWWFTNCFQSHLNGAYIRSPLALQNTPRNGLHWNTYQLYHSMKQTTMRIRRQSTY
ncbi:unnamed protein product [Rotaria sordida]|uniref:Fibrinogen C-terminal domain-containing protein n=2 Tax=Rotaria sordida TaxID=392033 RepID=A0A815XWU0_9BILA|nr:unnamed protein product [Rotaria sordida]CAF1562805.1 unnamed protein product [Rotaria sordida]